MDKDKLLKKKYDLKYRRINERGDSAEAISKRNLEKRLKKQAAKHGGSRRKSRKGRKSRKVKRRTAKVGSKSNPYKNKTACMKGRRSGKVFFKRKGRVVSMKKKK